MRSGFLRLLICQKNLLDCLWELCPCCIWVRAFLASNHLPIDDFEDNRSLLSSGLNTYWNGAHRYLEKYLIGAGRKCVV